jgi:hypothetical protein
MNTNNYATLDQAKKLKELGFPQTETDCVWIHQLEIQEWALVTRESCLRLDGDGNIIDYTDGEGLCNVDEWYAAPSSQEIILSERIEIDIDSILRPFDNSALISFGHYLEAQARSAAYIWEKENK